MNNPGLYVIITNPCLPYTRIAEICVAQGITMLQLREKDMDDRQLLRIARDIKSITAGTATRFVINDRADIAALCQADILHLGQGDVAIEEARKIVGDMPIGLSTHSLEEAREAITKNPLYIGCGPIYPTPTKATPDPAVGIDLLRKVVEISTVPVVAIGGVFPHNLELIKSTGAQSWSMVRYLMETPNLEERIIECR